MDLGLRTRVVLITGAGGGIGPTIATAFASEGAAIGLHVRDASAHGRAHDTADAIRAAGGNAIVVGADLRSSAAVDSMVGQVTSELGAVGVLVNATSAFRTEGVTDIDDASWDSMIGDMLGAT
ncbi:MAG: SDR family NAD(P)-dependent oxidoreductase, partial [Candidatus Limnocylindria bacterium]